VVLLALVESVVEQKIIIRRLSPGCMPYSCRMSLIRLKNAPPDLDILCTSGLKMPALVCNSVLVLTVLRLLGRSR
jgi:hypothetical protein